MKAFSTFVAAVCLSASASSVVLADSLPKLLPGEAIVIMPDGQMARAMVSDPSKRAALLESAKPIPWCNMLMVSEDGHVLLVNTDPHNPMVICEDMAAKGQ